MSPGTSIKSKEHAQRRRNARQACDPCRRSKRKCDGQTPCSVCQHFGSTCSYHGEDKRYKRVSKSNVNPKSQQPTSPEDVIAPPTPLAKQADPVRDQLVEAASGLLSSQKLAARTNSPALDGFPRAWNLGIRTMLSYAPPTVSSVVSQEDIRTLASIYFQKVHPVFDFVNIEEFEEKLSSEWAIVDDGCLYNPIFCGVAALGSLFSAGGHPKETALLECARVQLEQFAMSGPPAVEHLAGWLLRVLYLRCTASPYCAWFAMCTAMHVAQATRLSDEDKWPQQIASAAPHAQDCYRRQLWIATTLGAWISFEYGLCGPSIPEAINVFPYSSTELFQQKITMYQLSKILEPEASKDHKDLQHTLQRVIAFRPSHDELRLDRSYLLVCILRRLRILNNALSDKCVGEVIEAAADGLQACKRLALEGQPWWHVANVPFQYLCILLAFDTRLSLLRVGSTLETINFIAEKFPSREMRRTAQVSRVLVDAFRKKKEDENTILADGLAHADGTIQYDGMTNGTSDPETPLFDPDIFGADVDWERFDWDAFLGSGSLT